MQSATTTEGLRLLPRDQLVRTGPVDHADWNFRGPLGFIQRQRFSMITALLGQRRYGRLLEIGYGSGVFLPELARRCDELWAVDVHGRGDEVSRRLAVQGVQAKLLQGSATSLPLADKSVDCVVGVSTLEFVPSVVQTCREVSRLLRPGGVFVTVTPGSSPLLDLGLWMLTGKSAQDDFGQRRDAVVPALVVGLRLLDEVRFPARNPLGIALYRGFRLTPR